MLKLWSYDLAREQCPTEEFLHRLCHLTQDSGYDGIGLYMEHRFAYPSAPWAHGRESLQPEVVARLQNQFPSLQIIPFINLLGHCEGFIYTEEGKSFAEERFKGLQACPSNPGFREFARGILQDTLNCFDSHIVHIGGDETAQLAQCPSCSGKSKAELFANHFLPLIQAVIDAGRRPAIWADMVLEHPELLEVIPKETLLFDWQYFDGFKETTPRLLAAGFEVVCCPTLHTYNAAWMHVDRSQANLEEAIAQDGKLGVCLTTWECALMGNYLTLTPAIKNAGRQLCGVEPKPLSDWDRLMGIELEKLGGPFAVSRIRSGLKCRLLLYSNPFLAWMHHASELFGPIGDEALKIADHAIAVAPDVSCRGVAVFVYKAIEFVRLAEQARQAYANELPGVAAATLSPCRQIFDDLEKVARATLLNAGGSMADIERCRAARKHVETVILRIKEYGDGQLGYLPAFEILTHPKFMPHDQGSWWLINKWANE
ncbi:MAG: family 20 glycosylhydrolase [Fimbriimonadaceae bacterium]